MASAEPLPSSLSVSPHLQLKAQLFPAAPTPFRAVIYPAIPGLGMLHPMDSSDLVQSALKARAQAYAPYSRFQVGAALLTKSGAIVPGANLENASYGLTICAERAAVGNAIVAGHRDFLAIAVASETGVTPCGACRQVLHERAPSRQDYCGDDRGSVIKTSLGRLLPDSWGARDVGQ